MFYLNGQNGPFDSGSGLGWYGRNAAINAIEAAKNGKLDDNFQIRYSRNAGNTVDPNKSAYYDAFGYAKESIKAYDKDKDGTINMLEICDLYGGDLMKGLNYMRIADTNFDGVIDTKEQAAVVLFQDQLDSDVYDENFSGTPDGKITQKGVDRFNALLTATTADDPEIEHLRADAKDHLKGIQNLKESKKTQYNNLERSFGEIYEDFLDNKTYTRSTRNSDSIMDLFKDLFKNIFNNNNTSGTQNGGGMMAILLLLMLTMFRTRTA